MGVRKRECTPPIACLCALCEDSAAVMGDIDMAGSCGRGADKPTAADFGVS
jgi:hypothetical protein